MRAQAFPVPDRLNLALTAAVFCGAVTLLWLGSRASHWYTVLPVGVAFSYLMLTDYALLHEAAHDNLQASPRRNYALGVLTGLLFPMPFSMIRITHQGHHLRNRTDYEMFDLYYERDRRWIKVAQWYGILCGLFWPWIPLGAAVAALSPRLFDARIFRQARSSSYLVGDIRGADLRALRAEAALILGFFAALFWLLDLDWKNTLVLYACFSVNWSTRQYIGHAFSRRDVIEGAWNLRHNAVMTWVLLHGEWDLNHHRRPDVPWLYLPSIDGSGARLGYGEQYRRLWLGPRPAGEPGPESLRELPLSVHR